MSVFKRLKEKAIAQGVGYYNQLQNEAQQFSAGRPGRSQEGQQPYSQPGSIPPGYPTTYHHPPNMANPSGVNPPPPPVAAPGYPYGTPAHHQQQHPPRFFKEPPTPPPVVREDGEPNPTLYECPESRTVHYPTSWHHLTGVEGFLVCTRCFERHIANTHLAPSFPATPLLPTGSCSFYVPRVKQRLWPEACRTGNLGPLGEYAVRRAAMPPCPGDGWQNTATMTATQLLDVSSSSLPGFHLRTCATCYEDYLLAAPFVGHLTTCVWSVSGDDAACAMRLPYLIRAAIECGTWAEFATAASMRLALPTCDDGKGTTTKTRRLWRRAMARPEVVLCEACCLDQVGLTPFEVEFKPVGEGALCQAQRPAVSVLLGVALQRQDFGVFVRGATAMALSVPCTEGGIRGGTTWYTLALAMGGGGQRCEAFFRLCPGCFASMIEPFGLSRFFQAVAETDASATHLCSFHPSMPNFGPYLLRLQEAIDVGLWSRFAQFVARVGQEQEQEQEQQKAPPCPRATLTPNLIWYGYQDCGICPACYNEVCVGTALASSMPIQAALVTGPTMCSMYSPRMRQLYAEACARGSPDALVEFAHTRALAHANTLLRAEAMRQIRAMQTMQAVHQGSLSAMYTAGQSFSLAAGTTSAYAHGNSSLGWHPTASGAMAAQAQQNMQIGFAQASSPATTMEIASLEAQWLEYE